MAEQTAMDPEVRKATAASIFSGMADVMGNLMSRWCDEAGYEDIAEYKKVLDPYIEKVGGRITKMIKRPFGFEYELGGCLYRMTMKATGAYEYKRIK